MASVNNGLQPVYSLQEDMIDVTLLENGAVFLQNVPCGIDQYIDVTLKELGWPQYEMFVNAAGKDTEAIVKCYASIIDSWTYPSEINAETLKDNKLLKVCIEIDKAIRNYCLCLIRFDMGEQGVLPEPTPNDRDRMQEVYKAQRTASGGVIIYDVWVRGKPDVEIEIKPLGWEEYEQVKGLVSGGRADGRTLARTYSSMIERWSLDEPVTALALTDSRYFHLCMVIDQALKVFCFRRTRTNVVNNRRAKKTNISSKRKKLQ